MELHDANVESVMLTPRSFLHDEGLAAANRPYVCYENKGYSQRTFFRYAYSPMQTTTTTPIRIA